MHNRTDSYNDRCRAAGIPSRIQFGGVKKYGDLTYGDDGMLCQARKRIGPYLVCRRFGGEELVLRFSEQKNLHRVEASRWEVLLYIKRIWTTRMQVLEALKTSMGRRKKSIAFYNNRWTQLSFKDGTYTTDILHVDEKNVLDAMVEFGQHPEESKLTEKFLRLQDSLSRWNSTAARIAAVLQGMFRDLNPHKDFNRRSIPIEIHINGRYYVSADEHIPPGSPDRHWPSPLNPTFDLDEARYEQKVGVPSS